MQLEAVVEARKPGRPSHYPVLVRYSEDEAHHALIQGFAEKQAISFAEAQRIINRAGIQALRLIDA